MDTERGATIELGGETLELVLTTRATKEICARYGGLEALGDKLLQPENTELALSEIIWLVATLANQSILLQNLQKHNPPRELISEEYLELLTTPYDLIALKDAIMESMLKGTKRNIVSDGIVSTANPTME